MLQVVIARKKKPHLLSHLKQGHELFSAPDQAHVFKHGDYATTETDCLLTVTFRSSICCQSFGLVPTDRRRLRARQQTTMGLSQFPSH